VSHFSNALDAALAATGITQAAICAATGLSTPAMSKYVRGAAKVGPGVAGKIIRHLPAPHDAALLAAFLRDQTPNGLAHLVSILATGPVREDSPDPIPSRAELDGPARELLGYFARRITDPPVRAMLETTRGALEA